ncbi:MAG: hypothetical protein IPN10_08600 [Saprospiraceae bacterium]|nr:hypothetical protein [Saprospiraceae bacterium]
MNASDFAPNHLFLFRMGWIKDMPSSAGSPEDAGQSHEYKYKTNRTITNAEVIIFRHQEEVTPEIAFNDIRTTLRALYAITIIVTRSITLTTGEAIHHASEEVQ